MCMRLCYHYGSKLGILNMATCRIIERLLATALKNKASHSCHWARGVLRRSSPAPLIHCLQPASFSQARDRLRVREEGTAPPTSPRLVTSYLPVRSHLRIALDQGYGEGPMALNRPTSMRPTSGSSSVPSLAILTSLLRFSWFRKSRVRWNGSRLKDSHSSLKGLPQVCLSSTPETSLTSEPLSELTSSASQKIVPLAKSSMIRPFGTNSVDSVGMALGKSSVLAFCALGANSMAAAG